MTEFRGNHLVHVQPDQEENQEVDAEHKQCRIKRVIVVDYGRSRTVDANTGTFVVGKLYRALHKGDLRQERCKQF